MKETKSLPLFVMTIFLLSVLILGGCKKDDCNADAVPKIKTHSNNGYTGNYQYDEQGRLSSSTGINPSTGQNDDFQYIYSDSTVLVIRNGIPDTIVLNSQGYDNSFLYDVEGHKIKDLAIGDTFIWSDNNMVSVIHFGDTTTVAYLSDKTNTIGNPNYGLFYRGKDSKNLIASITRDDSTTILSYEFDSKGRVIEKNGWFYEETFTYY